MIPIIGDMNFTFKIYNMASAPTRIWESVSSSFLLISFFPFGGGDRDDCEGPTYSRRVVSRNHSGVSVVYAARLFRPSWHYVSDPLRIDGWTRKSRSPTQMVICQEGRFVATVSQLSRSMLAYVRNVLNWSLKQTSFSGLFGADCCRKIIQTEWYVGDLETSRTQRRRRQYIHHERFSK